jgi:crossover junction endodeoxyribonuclease RuvC
MRILGIDPGSRFTGYGIVEVHGRAVRHVTSGVVRVADEAWPTRLQSIFHAVRAVVDEYRPDTLAIERVFVHRNAESALKLGQARGAALCAALVPGVDVCEYSPNQIKQAIVGRGHAAKEQVQHMIRLLLDLREMPAADSADALAVALCHAHTSQTALAANVTAAVRGARRWRQVPEALLPRVKQGGSR